LIHSKNRNKKKRGKGNMAKSFFRIVRFLFIFAVLSSTSILYASPIGGNVDQLLMSQLQSSSSGTVQVEYHALTGMVRFIGASPETPVRNVSKAAGLSREDAARSFLQVYGPLFGVKDQATELSVMKSKSAGTGRSFVKYQQLHKGIPVIAGELNVQLDQSGNVLSANGETSPDISLDTTPAIDTETAGQTALAAVAKWYKSSGLHLLAKPELWIYNPALLGTQQNTNTLVWRMEVADYAGTVKELVLVDAHSERIVLHFSEIKDALYRKIYNNNNDSSKGLPGVGPVRIEGQAVTGNADVDNAYTYLGDTYNFFFNNFGRNSIDGAGLQLIATVKYCDPSYSCPFANAFWNGEQMVFGDTYASADDVVGHELTHGVTEKESGLFYYMQSGAINESLSDIFGEFIDLTNGKGNDTAGVRWLMGEDLPIGAIRSMKTPSLYGDPDKMTSISYVCGSSDQGGVHSNSGIGNKAAYLMVDGATFNGKTITGIGIDKTAQVYYEANTNLLTSGSDYADLGTLLYQACLNVIGTAGITSADCTQVKNATLAVEMDKQPTSCPASEAPVCDTGTPSNIFFDNMDTLPANWTFSPVSGGWQYTTGYAASGINSLWGPDLDTYSDISATSKSIALPAGKTIYMHFKHAYDFESDYLDNYDGGVLEYSTNGGSTWLDAGSLITDNGYSGTISSCCGNSLAGRSGFVNLSNGYMSSRLNLSSLAGQNVELRFRAGSDELVGGLGWLVDDVKIYTCQSVLAPTNLKATSVLAGQVNLAWTNNSGGGTAFKIYRKAGAAAFTLLTTTAAGATTYNDLAASGNTSTTPYSYYIKACHGSVCSAQTKTATLPYKPVSLKATKGTGKINLSWTDKSSNETGFQVYRKDGAAAWTLIKTTAANAVAYSDTAVTSGHTYSYKVRAMFKSASPFAYGYSSYSNVPAAIPY
jgi:bacillolysin